jgi:hypothetical protein
VLSTAVAAPSAIPQTDETTNTPSRYATPSEILGPARRSAYTTGVSAAIHATAAKIPGATEGDVGRINSDSARSRINQQAYPRLATTSVRSLSRLRATPHRLA